MTAPRRPEPDRTLQSRLRTYVATGRARWVASRELRLAQAEGAKVSGVRHGSLLFTALIALGSGLVAIGALWAWQVWSTPSAPPVDDLLPFLVADGAGAEQSKAGPSPVELPPVEPATEAAPTTTGVATATMSAPSPSPPPIVDAVVHVSGAVNRPGVVHLPVGSRVFEAVEAAGGAADAADLDRVNLAAPIVDGERIHVPDVGEDQVPALVPSERPLPVSGAGALDAGSGAGSAGGAQPLIVDLNLATVAELEELPGVGPATAEAIVRTREARGPFRAVEELLEVTGIGEKKLEQLRPYVWVQAP